MKYNKKCKCPIFWHVTTQQIRKPVWLLVSFGKLGHKLDTKFQQNRKVILFVNNCSAPVSYTHLDVYKRQTHRRLLRLPQATTAAVFTNTGVDAALVDALTNSTHETVCKSVRAWHDIKYTSGQPDENSCQAWTNHNMDKTVNNIPDWQLNNINKAVLAKGEKFVVTSRIPVEDLSLIHI